MTKIVAGVLAVLALSACASSAETSWRAQEGVDYRVDVIDRPQERRFDLTFISLSDRPLCFATESWPFHGFIMTWDGRDAAVETAGQRYPIGDHNMGVCVMRNACGSRVEAGGQASGHLSYDRFPGAPFDEVTERSLQFNIAVGACQGGERPV